ncbi:MAG: viroplasmin family protein [Candidatus Portnoybacteria bacterium]|nr:viroplasmin family protein [Candidatus Portnoybacteria bacterium]
MKTKKYYAYIIPGTSEKGIMENWQECEKIVSGKSEARYKGFPTREEARAWLDTGGDYGFKKQMEPGIYFDAGTGRGKGVEINVTDEQGESLLFKVMPKKRINRFGAHWIFGEATNNYGELLACKYALQIALKEDIKKIFGDSELVVNYWSKGFIKKKEVLAKTVGLARSAAKLRREFEEKGGEIIHISGDQNPADLGFHR